MYIRQKLLRDGSLILSFDESLRSAVSEWMPSLPEESVDDHPEGPSIRVDHGDIDPFDGSGMPSLMLGRVKAWVDSGRGFAALTSSDGDVHARADLESRVANVVVSAEREPLPADVTSLLTITAALLLVRDARTAMHSAGVVDPGTGKAWVLCGDTHSGKSTTTANLIKAGWLYLSDDYVVLSRAGEEIEIEGWPDDFHIDEGWARGESTGVRSTMREADLPAGRRLESATLGGILFTRVSADEKTVVTPIAPVVALERLMRQSPWLVADSESAGKVLQLLSDAASTPCGELRLGLDTYRDPDKLAAVISEFAARAT